MKNAQLANSLHDAIDAKEDSRTATREESIVMDLLNPVSIRLPGTASGLETGANLAGESLLVGDEGGPEHGEDAVEESVDHFETARLSVPRGGEVTLVPGLTLKSLILEDDVSDLEDLEGHGVGRVLTDSLEDAGEEGSADDLVLGGFGVREADSCVSVVLAVEPGEVLVVATEDEGHDLAPAGHGGFVADNVAELVDHEGSTDGGALVGAGAWEVVITVADGEIFHDIAGVQYVGSRRRDRDLDEVLVLGGGLRDVGHLVKELAEALGGLAEAGAAVEVVDLDFCCAVVEVGRHARLAVVVRYDLDGGDGEAVAAVYGEHGNHGLDYNIELRGVCGGDFYQDILGIEGDLGVVTVDDGRKREDGSAGVVDDWIYGRIANNVKIATKVLVLVVELHQLPSVHLLSLIKGHEVDLLRREGLVGEGTLYGVEIVGTDRYQSPLPRQVLVKFIL